MPLPRRRSQQHQYQRQRLRQIEPTIVLLAFSLLVVAQSLTVSPTSTSPCVSRTHRSRGDTWRSPCAQRRAKKTGGGGLSMAAVPGDCRSTLVVIGGGAAGYFGAIQAASSSSLGERPDSSSSDAVVAGSTRNNLSVVVLEAGKLPLQKVKISGGGRCNVMHDTSKAVSLIAQGYPRGSKHLIGPFKSLFGPTEAAAWFRARGVTLKTEEDGRMFPVTDDSQTIIDCLEGAAKKAAVDVVTSARVTSIVRRTNTNAAEGANDDDGSETRPRFDLTFTTATPLPPHVREVLGAVSAAQLWGSGPGDGKVAAGAGATAGRAEGAGKTSRVSYIISCDYVLQATGAAREGHRWAEGLGHAVSTPVPSLFTLTIRDPRLAGLAGLSVQDTELKFFAEAPTDAGGPSKRSGGIRGGGNIEGDAVTTNQASRDRDQVAEAASNKSTKKKKKGKARPAVSQRGPLLITHSGVSGPAALKLSAFGARVLSEGSYKGKLVVNWLAGTNASKALEDLQAFRARNSKKTVYAFCPIGGAGPVGALGGLAGAPPPPPSSTIPRRLWQSLALAAGVAAGDKWADVSKAKLLALAQQLTACDLQIVGKGSFKEEFVTCGGVALSALDMRTMESRNVPGLFFAGEVVDIDGITGGFNFQSAWTTGWVAGNAIGTRAAAEQQKTVGLEKRRFDGSRDYGGRENGAGERINGGQDRRLADELNGGGDNNQVESTVRLRGVTGTGNAVK